MAETPKILAYLGGIFAIIAGLVSLATAVPLGSHLLEAAGVIEEPIISGSIVRLLGVVGIIGGVAAAYFAREENGQYVIAGGVLGLLAPCVLSILAIIGGYMMLKKGEAS
ncbi:hypothetical protein APE_1626 [Aeropyrum pernix K1]|uniref:DUF4064 domain-containing protein n=1 Tax=Aeropyrum pernix (strain ATCC 700893 / DSM 11879 / JCM 9820 / NBRC 100138 / K1) TaxID=272557 RepID=Q9YBH2_AERPE|nr:hypothetical protein [Aeropyrum pernix]BAA80626.1 hypothetical protein APE_1626 [Aeropyrum pernix K1]